MRGLPVSCTSAGIAEEKEKDEMSESEERAMSAMKAYGDEREREGLRKGLFVAELIKGYLTRQVKGKKAQAAIDEIRVWAEREIETAKEKGQIK